ncbi:MAG: enoyl-CoA hydratase-related protein [Pseudomonadota bacterium]
MSYENIVFQIEENVAIIKFNRPKALNALNPAVLREVKDALEKIEADSSIRALIFTGEGDKAFVAGADIAHMVNFTPLQCLEFARDGWELFFRLERLPIPVIACVNGFALGGGNELAMACDFIYASENARFGQPEINLGVTPGFGGGQRLCKLVGKPMAKEICMTGAIISAKEAKEIGLVNKVFPPEKLWEETMKTAKVLASKGKVSIRAMKEGIDRGFDVDIREGYFIAADAFAISMASPDGKEGFSAFLEKRKPHFKGELT